MGREQYKRSIKKDQDNGLIYERESAEWPEGGELIWLTIRPIFRMCRAAAIVFRSVW
jgi:hypothetical protein